MSIVSFSPTERQKNTNTNNKEPIVSSSPTERGRCQSSVLVRPKDRKTRIQTKSKNENKGVIRHPAIAWERWFSVAPESRNCSEEIPVWRASNPYNFKELFFQSNRCLLCTPNETVIGRWLGKCYFSEINLAIVVRIIVSIPIWRYKLIFAKKIVLNVVKAESTTAGSSTTGCW